jgi:flagellar basal-body rod protein FlgB
MDSIFGLSSKALEISEERSVLLASNIANASTPNYKAKDIDFQKILKDESENPATSTSLASSTGSHDLVYRVPMQKSLDNNTVDEELERKNFLQNSIHFQVNLTFVKNKTDQLLKAIKGE